MEPSLTTSFTGKEFIITLRLNVITENGKNARDTELGNMIWKVETAMRVSG